MPFIYDKWIVFQKMILKSYTKNKYDYRLLIAGYEKFPDFN